MIALSLLVDVRSNIILDAAVNTINDLSAAFLSAQLKGRYIIKNKSVIIESLGRYQAPAQKSIIVAFKATVRSVFELY